MRCDPKDGLPDGPIDDPRRCDSLEGRDKPADAHPTRRVQVASSLLNLHRGERHKVLSHRAEGFFGAPKEQAEKILVPGDGQ